jgi:hypothetical protein
MSKNFDNFDWIKYKNKYYDLNQIKTKQEAWEHWSNYGVNENRIFFYDNDSINLSVINILNEGDDVNNNYDIFDNNDEKLIHLKNEYMKLMYIKKNFDWEKYVNDNKDLLYILDNNIAWHHWILHGRRENRIIDTNLNAIVNNTEIHNGRFGNLFFINMILHFISKKYDLKTTYKYYNQFLKLGIELFIGNNTYKENIHLTELNYFELMNKNNNFTNIIINNYSWFQNYEFCLFLQIYFNKNKVKNNIIKNNKFSERYNKNNDLFIHVRLDDIEDINSNNSFDYYDNIIKKYTFDNGYISSDNIKSLICYKLINKYSLKIINFNEEETIMFGSTCNTIILSGGTFSWLIGFLAYYSKNINYPIRNNKWYGDIFVYNNWIGNY